VGLLGRRQAIGHAFHITSDEALTWDEIHRQAAAAARVEPRIVHIASDFIAACMPDFRGRLIGDASVSSVFDTTKIKRFVPEFRATMPFAEGIKRTIAWFDADPARQQVDAETDARWDRVIAAYDKGLANARMAFAGGA
jgi:nucleoside-diphosphate-sugar epimerase